MINVITSDVNEIINNPSEAASKLFEPSEALLGRYKSAAF